MEPVFEKLSDMISACYPTFYLHSFEYERTWQKIQSISNNIKSTGAEVHLFKWNCVEGLVEIQANEVVPVKIDEEVIVEPTVVLQQICKKDDKKRKDIYVLEDFNNYIDENEVKFYLRHISHWAKFNNCHVIILSAIYKLPVELEKNITVLSVPLPGRVELEKTLRSIEKSCAKTLSIDLRNKMIDAALGMTTMEADLAFCLAAVKDEFGENSPYTVSSEKEQIIRKSGILDYFPKNENLQDVGGMEVLKDWLFQRKMAYEKNARDFGLDEPKGLLLLGVPGCGKSLTAKSIASFWNMPLLRLDIGKVFQGLVGSSEDNIRKAISTAEAVAPCILWIDEIEKGLSGVQSSGATDGGVTSRIFSTILTWMQEKTAPVFVVATANNINLLPPELLRKGRFDEIFFVDLPSKKERENIFSIHLKKKGQSINNFPIDALSEKSEGFNGAEIEECIKEAMFKAYVECPENPQLKSIHLMQSIDNTVPLSTTMKEQITSLREWAKTRAKNASLVDSSKAKREMPILLTRPELELERSFLLSSESN